MVAMASIFPSIIISFRKFRLSFRDRLQVCKTRLELTADEKSGGDPRKIWTSAVHRPRHVRGAAPRLQSDLHASGTGAGVAFPRVNSALSFCFELFVLRPGLPRVEVFD